MTRAEFDFSELDAWRDVLTRAPVILGPRARAVITKGALNIKTEARATAPGTGSAKHYPNSISYDLYDEPGGLMAETGPAEDRRQWGLGNLLEYGSSHNRPHPHLEPALDHEAPRFLRACEALAGDVIER